MNGKIGKSVRSRIQHFVQVRIWGMDIHPSAKIALSASIDRTWPRGIHIGADTLICEEAGVLTHDIVRGVYLDTRIGERCYVGPRAIVLPGMTIGDDSIVMPGTLVTADLPPNSIAVGNPARIAPRGKEADTSHGLAQDPSPNASDTLQKP